MDKQLKNKRLNKLLQAIRNPKKDFYSGSPKTCTVGIGVQLATKKSAKYLDREAGKHSSGDYSAYFTKKFANYYGVRESTADSIYWSSGASRSEAIKRIQGLMR